MEDPQPSILAIDQSTSSSGWCYLADGRIQEYGVIKTSSKLQGLEAAIYQTAMIDDLVTRFLPTVMAIEDIYLPNFFNSFKKTTNGNEPTKGSLNAKTIILLGSLRGMLIGVAAREGMEYVLVTSPDICNHLGIAVNTPRVSKKRASRQIAAMELFGDRTRYKDIPEDAADAIAIAQIAERRLLMEARIEPSK